MTKGTETRDRILDHAFRLAGLHGLHGLTLGTLANELGISKSGLFAHFETKEQLQIEILRVTAERFGEEVVAPALKEPRGTPRLKRMFENWVKWTTSPDLPGGCPMVAASVELDDREGLVREVLVEQQRQILGVLARAAKIAVEEGQFRKGLDTEQFAFEMEAIMLGLNHARRLMQDPKSERRARAAFTRLLESSAAPA